MRYQLIIKLCLAQLIWKFVLTKLRFFSYLSIEIRNGRPRSTTSVIKPTLQYSLHDINESEIRAQTAMARKRVGF